MACPPLYVAPPSVTAYGYGLYSVAEFPATDSDRWMCGGVEWQPWSCDLPSCYDPECSDDGQHTAKEFHDGIPTQDASVFGVYGSLTCRTTGISEADFRERVIQSLLLGEQRTVERSVWTGDCAADPHLADPAATVLNANNPPALADALTPAAAIAALEECAANNYAGTPVIHGPRGAIALLAAQHQLVRDGARLRTWAGSLVAGYGGSPNTGPDGTVAPPGTFWLYITGPVMIRRSDVRVYPDTYEAAVNRQTNEATMISERLVSVGFDTCARCAVLVSAAGCP